MSEILGYPDLSRDVVNEVNDNKRLEERLLRLLDDVKARGDLIDQRWLAIARTHVEEGFMAWNRALMRPERVELVNDNPVTTG